MASHNELGNRGENLAVEFLQNNGYTILDRNWRFKKAEIDIIALKNDILAGIEVKTRSTNYFGNPQDFVSTKKIQLLVEAMDEYVSTKDLDVEVRFDIIGVLISQDQQEIEHIEDAFFHF